jgi:hypothetical protein
VITITTLYARQATEAKRRKLTIIERNWKTHRNVNYHFATDPDWEAAASDDDRTLASGFAWSKTDRGYLVTRFDMSGTGATKSGVISHDFVPHSDKLAEIEAVLADWEVAAKRLYALRVGIIDGGKHTGETSGALRQNR